MREKDSRAPVRYEINLGASKIVIPHVPSN
jgi:hypothetical protein